MSAPDSSKTFLERLWEVSRRKGISRRQFNLMVAAVGGASLLSACDTLTGGTKKPEGSGGFVKDTSPFEIKGTDMEVKMDLLQTWLTPAELFFVRNNIPATPKIEAGPYRLKIEGDAAEKPLEITFDELRKMPAVDIPAFVECAGNQRSLFEKINGKPAKGGQWVTGGIGMATWTGVPLGYLLEMAGVKPNAAFVNVKGLDTEAAEGGFSRPMTLEKALDPNTIIAYKFNGGDIPPDNGYPVRAIVPGWVGSNNIKWAGYVTVSANPIWVKTNTTSYVMVGPDWPKEQYAPADGGPITIQTMKSLLALAWPAKLSKGMQIIRGYATAPVAPIAKVEWSDDKGAAWQEARIISPNLQYAWVHFEFDWDAQPGKTGLMVRATDTQGNSQPDSIPFNELGYLFNQVYEHPVEIA